MWCDEMCATKNYKGKEGGGGDIYIYIYEQKKQKREKGRQK